MMKQTIDLFGKILTNILTALYEPFGFSLFLSFFAMFFYLYAYEPTAAGKGWKSAIVTWYQKFKESEFFRKLFFLAFVIRTLLKHGFAVDPATQAIVMEPYKYFHNLMDMPLLLVLFLVGVVGVLFGLIKSILNTTYTKGIWFAGIGTVLTVLALLLCVGYNHTAYYPSTADLQSSLTLANSCSSKFTLTTMAYVSILVPFVLAYIVYAWRAIDRKPITTEEMKEDDHAY